MRPRNPAEYELDVGSADVHIGDVVLVWSEDGDISNVSYEQVIDHDGYDHGYLKVFLIESSGNVSISTSQTADVIHTGDQNVAGISNHVAYKIHQWEDEQTFGQFSDHVDSQHNDFSDHDDYGSGSSHEDRATEHYDSGSGDHEDHTDGSSHYDHGNHWDHYDEEDIDPDYKDYQDYYDHDDVDHDDFADHSDYTDHGDSPAHNDWSDHNDSGSGDTLTGHGDAPIDGLRVGDLIIEWDEDEHVGKGWESDTDYNHLYFHRSSGLERSVWQPTGTAPVERTINSGREHDALHFELLGVPNVTNLQAEPTEDVEIDLTWESEIDARHFYIYKKRKGKRFRTAHRVDGALREFNDTDVTSGTEYTYQVQSARATYSNTTFGKSYYDVGIGDLLLCYGEASLSGVSYDRIAKDIGINDELLEVYIMKESGQISVSCNGETEVIHRGRKDTEEVTDTRVRISSGDGSLETFADNLTEGDIILQWSSSDSGDDSGYMSFSGDARVLYTKSNGEIDRKAYQVFSEGDVTREDNGVELIAIDVDLSPINRLNDIYGEPSNKDAATANYPYIAIR